MAAILGFAATETHAVVTGPFALAYPLAHSCCRSDRCASFEQGLPYRLELRPDQIRFELLVGFFFLSQSAPSVYQIGSGNQTEL